MSRESTLERFTNIYHEVITKNIDPRSQDWLLRSSSLTPVAIIALYLLFVKKWGPAYMANREPFNVKGLMIAYNFIQVVLCTHIFWQGGRIWLEDRYNFFCQPVDKADTENNRQMANLVHLYAIVKVTDLLDTVFFILRKKFSHASFLHVYHHSGMILVGFLACVFSLNGHLCLLGVINSFVHSVMYSYYLYTAIFPEHRPSLAVKKALTQLQLAQFALLIVHCSLPLLQPSCNVQRLWAFLMLVQYSFMIILFSDFYIKAYVRKGKEA